jgi:hypothetical protein
MSVVDFGEIPQPHLPSGDQDLFELFARDFLEALGFRILQGPGRGADRGRDLLVAETVDGTISKQERTWVVSAKHKAHSGRSVTDADEPDPIGRVRKFEADGFMGFYSTLPSSGLEDTLTRLEPQTDIYVFDRGRIEQHLLSRPELQTAFQQYFPQSHKDWLAHRKEKEAVEVWGEIEPLYCCHCGKNILLEDRAVVVLVYEPIEDYTRRKIIDVYWVCKGECDRTLTPRVPGVLTGWEDFADLRIPLVFIRWVCVHMSRIQAGTDIYQEQAFAKHRQFILAISQMVLKETTETQKKRIEELAEIPSFLGGLGS